jgi:hypothetical protein
MGNGTFTIVFAGDDVNANFRKPNAWFDYQFIGSSQSGVVGRSEKIEQQVASTALNIGKTKKDRRKPVLLRFIYGVPILNWVSRSTLLYQGCQ